MVFVNEWLIFSLILLGIWLIVFILNRKSRKEILWTSLFTMPFGLTVPFFVPEYWSPPSLFNLNLKTGFDIESLIFSFAIGGIVVSLYELRKMKHKKMSSKEIHSKRHRFHLLTLISLPLIFLSLYFLTDLNPIYSSFIAMGFFAVSSLLCRPDLKKKILWSGFLFLAVYFFFFLFFNAVYSYAVEKFWNLSALSGILILGVPLEELIFGFLFGLSWGSIYEYVKWYRIEDVKSKNERR